MLTRFPTRSLAAFGAAASCLAAGFVVQPPALAVRGANLTAKSNVIGGDVIATVLVGTSAHRRCHGSVRHAYRSARLPSLKTDRTGGGTWRWKVADDVPGGTWHVRVRCELPGETVTAEATFHAPRSRQTGRKARGLIAPGSMSAEPGHSTDTSQGVIGVSEGTEVAEHRGGQCDCASTASPAGPEIQMQAPTAGETVSGEVTVEASGSVAAVLFEAFYSETPQVPGTASWHMLGTDTTPGDGFAISWDTTEVPNQGLPRQRTVRVRAAALDHPEETTGAGSTRRVSVSNPGEDGSYRYHVFGACAKGGSCEVALYGGPGRSFAATGSRQEGDEVDLVCQAEGEPLTASHSSDVWDRLSDGSWIADRYVDTPGANPPAAKAFSPPIPVCE